MSRGACALLEYSITQILNFHDAFPFSDKHFFGHLDAHAALREGDFNRDVNLMIGMNKDEGSCDGGGGEKRAFKGEEKGVELLAPIVRVSETMCQKQSREGSFTCRQLLEYLPATTVFRQGRPSRVEQVCYFCGFSLIFVVSFKGGVVVEFFYSFIRVKIA